MNRILQVYSAILYLLYCALSTQAHADILYCPTDVGGLKMRQVYHSDVEEQGAARLAQQIGWQCTNNRVFLVRATDKLELDPEFNLRGQIAVGIKSSPLAAGHWTLFGVPYQTHWAAYENEHRSTLLDSEKRVAFQHSLDVIALETMYTAFRDVIEAGADPVQRRYRWVFWAALSLGIAKAESGRHILPQDSINQEKNKLLAVGTWQVAPSTFEGAGYLQDIDRTTFNPYHTRTNAAYFAYELRKKYDRIAPWARQGYATWTVTESGGTSVTQRLEGITETNLVYILAMAYNWGTAGMLRERQAKKPSNGYPEKVLKYLQEYCPGANTVTMTCSAEPTWYSTALEGNARIKGILSRLRQ